MVNFTLDGKMIFTIFVGTIIAATLIATISDSIFTQTNTIAVTNNTVTAAAVNTTLDVSGRELLTTIEIYNATNVTDTLVGLGGSLQTGTGTSGLLSVQLILNDTASAFAGESVNISYTANPDGFLSDGGARSIANLILIFAALAILVFTVVVIFQNENFRRLLNR